MQKIIFTAHCLLNTAAKVVLYEKEDMAAEETLRRRFLSKAVNCGIQLVQLPCPEFTLYGACRWGHVSNQFDNPFFRNHCRELLGAISSANERISGASGKVPIAGCCGGRR